MNTLRQLGRLFAETGRLFWHDPPGMIHVLFLRVFDGMDAAVKRLERIQADYEERS